MGRDYTFHLRKSVRTQVHHSKTEIIYESLLRHRVHETNRVQKNQKPHIVQEIDNASGQNSGAFSSGGDKEDLEVNRDAEDEDGADPETGLSTGSEPLNMLFSQLVGTESKLTDLLLASSETEDFEQRVHY